MRARTTGRAGGVVAVGLWAAALGGCLDVSPPEGRLACETAAECPSGWSCRLDERCWRTPDDLDDDAGMPRDGGTRADAGPAEDGGARADAGPAEDGGALVDAGGDTVSVVFDDDYGPSVRFVPFAGSDRGAAPTMDVAHGGTAAFRVAVPPAGYVGGAFVAEEGAARDLTGFDALRFFARADGAHRLDVAGIGESANGSAAFKTEVQGGLALSTEWREFTIPLPDPSQFGAAVGLFHFAEGSDEGAYNLFFDDVRYVRLSSGTVTNAQPAIRAEAAFVPRGGTFAVGGTQVTYTVGGADLTLAPAGPAFFQFRSDMTGVATVSSTGVVSALAEGRASITASLAGVSASGAVSVQVVPPVPPTGPTGPAPTPPVRMPVDVIALFSDAYAEVPVDTFLTPWSATAPTLTRVTLMGDEVLSYRSLLYAGIEATGANQINATSMTHLHLDVWIEGMASAGQVFHVKLVDWGSDGMYSTMGDNREAELVWRPDGGPSGGRTLTTGAWLSLDIPLSDFEDPDFGVALTSRSHLSQIVLRSEVPVGGTTRLWLDNLYFYRARP